MPPAPIVFDAQIVGTVSAAHTLSVPLTVSLADLPQDAVVYAGGSAEIDAALSLVKLLPPVTPTNLRSVLGAQTAVLTLGGFSFSGGATSYFQSLILATQGADTAEIEIRFAPSDIGSRVEIAVAKLSGRIEGTANLPVITALLNLLSPLILNAVSNAFLSPTVTGIGLPPILVEPTLLHFKPQYLDVIGPPLGITITNKMLRAITISSLQPWGITDPDRQASDAHSFIVVSDSCTGQTLAPGGQCQVVWRFRPFVQGQMYSLRQYPIGDFADTSAGRMEVLGAGVPSPLSAAPGSFDFGPRSITTAGGEKMTFLTATQTVAVSALTFDGADSGSFAVVDETCVGRTLQAGNEAAVVVDFVPQHIGHVAASLLVIGADERNLVELTLRGVGTPAADLKVCVKTSAIAEALLYELMVTNDGPSAAVAATLWLQLPPGTRFERSDRPSTSPREHTEGVLSWKVGTLPRGQSVTVTASASLPPGATPNPGRAWASSATFDPNPATAAIDLLWKPS